MYLLKKIQTQQPQRCLSEVKNFFQKMLILAFEIVIVQAVNTRTHTIYCTIFPFLAYCGSAVIWNQSDLCVVVAYSRKKK